MVDGLFDGAHANPAHAYRQKPWSMAGFDAGNNTGGDVVNSVI
jgi:hypothetical protein